MSSQPRYSGHEGRACAFRRPRLVSLVLLSLLGLAYRPAPAASQVSFAAHAGIARSAVARAAAVRPAGRPDSAGPAADWGLHFGVGQGSVAPAPSLVVPTDVPDAAMDVALTAERMIETAARFVGTRYRWGGDSPSDGFDCSGFVRYVYAQQAIDLPRVSRAQARAGRRLPPTLDGLRPGDLLFFAQRGPSIDHVAMYAGEGRIIHASRSGRGVRYDELTGDRGRWYARHLVAVRRVIDDGAAAGADAPEVEEQHEVPLGEPFETLMAELGDDAPPPEL